MKSMFLTTPALTAYFAGLAPEPIGFLPSGRPVFAIAGGADDDPPKEDPPKEDPPKFEPITSQEDLDRRLGERLQRERAKFADYGDLKKKAEAHDKKLEEAMSDAEKAVAAARKEGESTAMERSNDRLRQAEARALAAAAKFRDPTDAVKFLDLKVVDVGDDGEVDSKALKDQLKTLAESKPYLVDDGKGDKKRPKPDDSQGGGSGGGGGQSGGTVAQVMADRRAAREAKNK